MPQRARSPWPLHLFARWKSGSHGVKVRKLSRDAFSAVVVQVIAVAEPAALPFYRAAADVVRLPALLNRIWLAPMSRATLPGRSGNRVQGQHSQGWNPKDTRAFIRRTALARTGISRRSSIVAAGAQQRQYFARRCVRLGPATSGMQKEGRSIASLNTATVQMVCERSA